MGDFENEPLYYFAYGSNLCRERLSISLKSLKFYCIAELKNYELVFCGSKSNHWFGSPANIRYNPEKSLLGAVWIMDKSELGTLDRQEGVDVNVYKRLVVNVRSITDNKMIECLVYEKVASDEPLGPPSKAYKNVIINGAKALNFPSEYIQYLRSFEDNGYLGPINVNLPKEVYESS